LCRSVYPPPSSASSPRDVPGSAQIRLGHLWLDALRFDQAIEAIGDLVRAGQGGSVFTPNVDHVVTAEDDPVFRDAYAGVSLSLADGQPLVWASRWLGTPLPERVAGSDLVWPLMERAARERWRVYLLGGPPGVAEVAAARLERELSVRVVGVAAPMIPLEAPPDAVDAASEAVAAAHPDLVLVGLGAPKQERWIHRALPRIRPAVALGVGAAIDFLAGRIGRAPRWVARSGLEWLYRLAREPRRLVYRYLVKDPRFLAIVARERGRPVTARTRPRPR
jgi:N-acetylglucosaminyldiphosphoundecaprenol N-acetyl-beta-D-mannosaminyltransferase